MDNEINFSLSRKKQRIEKKQNEKLEIMEVIEDIKDTIKLSKTSNSNNTQYITKKDDTLSEENNTPSEPFSKCSGCYPKFQPNQLAHCEDKYGCMYVDTDDSLTYSP